MRRTRLLFGYVLLLLLFASCKPRNVLSRSDLADVLYDLHMTEAVLSRHELSATIGWTHGLQPAFFNDLSYSAVLRKHELTQESFYTSIAWYSRHLNQFAKVYQLVEAKMETFQAEAQFGRSNASLDSTLLKQTEKEVRYHWDFVKVHPVKQDGMATLPMDSVLGFAAWFIQSYYPVESKEPVLVHRMFTNCAIIDTIPSGLDTISKSVRSSQPIKEEDSPTKNNVYYPKNSHFVDFKPIAQKVLSKSKPNSVAGDEKIRDRFRTRAKEVQQQQSEAEKK
jgi:hypothetical protein